jgi:pimeloyl-ACP methyl ester carboxylesterase
MTQAGTASSDDPFVGMKVSVAHTTGSSRVIVVPGLAVHAYAEPPVRHLRDNGYDARLLSPPAWRGIDHDLERYGRNLAADIDREGTPVDVLVGLSVGTQAVAVAASSTDLVKRLVLVSPTIDPAYRSMIKQCLVFARGDPHDKTGYLSHLPDWSRAGVVRIFRGFASAVGLHIEEILPKVGGAVTIIHTEYDPLTTHSYASSLAEINGARLVLMPGVSHSWPKADSARFLRFFDELLSSAGERRVGRATDAVWTTKRV